MAWLDFIKTIRQNDQQEKQRAQQGGFWNHALNAVDNTIDAGSNVVHTAAHAVDQAATDYFAPKADQIRVRDFLRELPGAAVKVGEGVGKFAGNAAQGFDRGLVNTYLTIHEAGRNDSINSRKKIIDEMKSKYSEAERNKLADEAQSGKVKDGPGVALYLARKQLGSLSDQRLSDRKAEIEAEAKTHLKVEAKNPVAKFFLGSGPDEVSQSAQATYEGAQGALKRHGIEGPAGNALAFAGAGITAALDAPTGVGSLVKGVGKAGIEQLAKEGGEDAVKQILRTQLPKLAEEDLAKLAPQLAKAGTTGEVKQILADGGKSLIKPLAAPIKAIEGNIKGGAADINKLPGTVKDFAANLFTNKNNTAVKPVIDEAGNIIHDAQNLVDTTVQDAKNLLPGANIPKPAIKPTGYGDQADQLLGNLRHADELKKPGGGFVQQAKEQFYDKLSPVNDFVKTIENHTGRKLTTEDNPYQLMRLYQGMPDIVQNRVQSIADILKQSPDINATKVIGMGRQIIDRQGRGISSTLTADDARAAISQVQQKLGAVNFQKAADAAQAVTDYNKGLLNDLHDAGIISDDALKAINDVGAHYFSKFNVVDHILNNDQNLALFGSAGSYNATKQSLNKILATAKGHAENAQILDPIESLVRSTDSAMRLIAKNNIWHSFNRLADSAPELVQRARDPEKVIQRISLSMDNKELRPIRNKLDRMIATRGSWVTGLQRQINQLEKKGLNLSLKNGGERMTNQAFDVAGLGGTVPTSQTGKLVSNVNPQQLIGEMIDTIKQGTTKVGNINPSKLGPRDTKSFLDNLIENGSRSDIDRIKKMVDSRDTKTHAILDELGTLKSQFDDVAGTIRNNVADIHANADQAAQEGYALISGFGKGVGGKLAVPKEVADVFTGKNAAQRDHLTGLMSTVNGFVKQNLTSNNPAFALITNPIRDFKNFAYNAQDVKANPLSIVKHWVGGFAQRIGQGDAYKRFVEAGGKSGFYADERTGQNLAQDIAREIRNKRVLGVKVGEVHNAKDFIKEAGRVISAPYRVGRDALHSAASVLEDAPRVAQFQASVKAGKTDAQAAFNARNVTVDFQQSGRIGQTVNAWIPFLNARFQGSIKTAEAVKRNPARAAAVYAGLTAAPILLAAANNSQHPDVMKMIPDSDRRNNFIIVLGNGKDENGRYNQVIKVPKSDVDKILGDPLENFARFLQHDDPKGFAETLTNFVGDVLPFDTVKDGAFNLSRAVGSVLPPLIKAPVEAVTNHSLYNDSKIVPTSLEGLPASEQVRTNDPNTKVVEKSTGPIAQFLAPLLGGGSPIKAENTIRNLSGSLFTEKPQDQLGGKLSGSSASKMNNEFYGVLKKTSPNKESASNHINASLAAGDYAEAQRTAKAYNQYLAEQFGPFAGTYGGTMTQELADVYSQQKIILTPRSIKQRQRNQLQKQAAQ